MGSVLSLSTTQTVAALLLFATVINYCLSTFKDPRRRLPRPPGPPGYPIIGSLSDHPTARPWLTYGDWAKKYGDMIYYEVLGQPILVLSSVKRINDLFEKRSKNYSDKPRLPMLVELMHWDIDFAFLPYGNWWRKHRRQFHQHFNPAAIPKYQPIQVEEVRTFTHRLLTATDLYMTIRWTFAAIIMRITYGIPVESIDSEYIQRADLTFAGLAEAAAPGKYLVDRFPIMKHIPAWFPGAEFRRKAARWYEINRDIRKLPFEHVRKEMEQGIAPPSVTASLISALPPPTDPNYPAEERISENVAAVAYLGGADTASSLVSSERGRVLSYLQTLSSVQAFFLLMGMHPEIAKKAQAQLDLVVGPDRLPDWEDRSSLPYIQAICKELLRWHSVTPLAVAHSTTEDDEYEGYFIPKGTIDMVRHNVHDIRGVVKITLRSRAILHDENVFEDPFTFRPERYLDASGEHIDESVLDPADGGAFGFGRRICPGRYLGNETLYLLISTVLAVYNITPKLDENGRPKKLEYKPTDGLISYPEQFDIDIKPRTAQAAALIHAIPTSGDAA